MKHCRKFKEQPSLFIATITAGVLTSLPSYAATFALSETSLTLDNFNQIPSDVATFGRVNLRTIALSGLADTIVDGDVIFSAEEPSVFADSNTRSVTFGTGNLYYASGDVEVQLIGDFPIDAQENFQFDFATSLNLFTSIEHLDFETVNSSASVSLVLLDSLTQEILDTFSVSGFLSTNLGDEEVRDFLEDENTTNFLVTNRDEQSSFGGAEEFIRASFTGSFDRYFEEDTEVTLIAIANNNSCSKTTAIELACKIPEPSKNTTIILFFTSAVFFRVIKHVVKLAH